MPLSILNLDINRLAMAEYISHAYDEEQPEPCTFRRKSVGWRS
jgi:hypothetical protein